MPQPLRRDRLVRNRRKRRLRIVLISIGSVLVLVLATVGIYAISLANRFESAERIQDVFPDDNLRPQELVGEAVGSQNILLLGSDTRESIGDTLESAVGQSDAIMVVHISADRQNVHVMSIMRDSWVEVEGYGNTKVNSAMARGGVPLAVQAVETLIDSRIDHVAIIDFEGFEGITDALGGVTLKNPIGFYPRHLKGAYFPEGEITLNGKEALAFVRERYSFEDGDFQRVRNQQLFIKAVMNKTLSRETLTNPVTISELVSALSPFMALDKDFSSGYAASLGFEMRDIRGDDVTFLTMPTAGTGMVGSQSVVHVDWDELAIIRDHFRQDTLAEYEPKKQTMRGPEG